MAGRRKNSLTPIEFEKIETADVISTITEQLKEESPVASIEKMEDGTLKISEGIDSYDENMLSAVEKICEDNIYDEFNKLKIENERLINEIEELQNKLEQVTNEGDDLLLKNSELELEISKLKSLKNININNIPQTPNLGNHIYTKPGYQNVVQCGKTRNVQNGYQDWV